MGIPAYNPATNMADSTKPASGCLILFALPFMAGGLFFVIVSYRSLDDPNFRNPWVAMVVGSVFALLGGLIMAAGFKVMEGAKQFQAVQAAYPGQPWMWRADWAKGQSRGQSGRATAGAWIFALGWNGISGSVAYGSFVHRSLGGPRAAYFFLALFLLIGIGAFCWAILLTLRRIRFGKTTMQLQTLPAPLGRSLQGSIDAHLPYPVPHGIYLVLSCINRVTSGGNHPSTRDHVLWQDSKTIPPEQIMAGPAGSSIPVSFDIPRDKPASNNANRSSQILWLLRAEADIPGANFNDTFEVPVFETHDSPNVADWHIKEEAQQHSHPPTEPIHPTVRVSPVPEGGLQFYFPAARNVSSAMGVTVFALLFSSLDFAVFHLRVPIFFGIFVGFFALLLTLISLNLWFGTATIVANSSGVSLRTNLLGMGGSKKWSASEIQSVYPKITMQSGSGGQAVAYYTTTIKDTAGRESPIGNALRDHNEAEWICLQISQLANIQSRVASA
jgi:hypothetical protein